jgi:hypothetical protein
LKVVLILAIALLLALVALLSGQQSSTLDHSQRKSWPVEKLPNPAPTAADIQLYDFQFERLAMSRYGPSPTQVFGPPSKATKYFVQPELEGMDAIVTAKFEAIDEHGALIATIPILKGIKPYGPPYFYGVMLVPDRPFRVVVSGKAIDGTSYRRTFGPFVPTSNPPPPNAGFPMREKPAEVKRWLALLEDTMQEQYLKLEQEFAKLPNGTIVMPRTRVFNVNYAVLFSPSNRPLGLRITYEVEFSQDGYYNPELSVYPDFENLDWRGKVEMRMFNGSIKPEPTEPSPQERADPHPFDAAYIYRANTTYHFTAELYPDYVSQNKERTMFCLSKHPAIHDARAIEMRKAILASKTPITYRVLIRNSDFEGTIEKFYSHNELYNNFVAEGAVNCEL